MAGGGRVGARRQGVASARACVPQLWYARLVMAVLPRRCAVVALAGLVAALAFVADARAQSAEDVAAARARLAHEPSASETVRQALKYFRVNPQALDSMRSAARSRALLPLFATGYRFDDDDFVRFEEQRMTSPRENDEARSERSHAFTLGAVWDLRELVFNPAEVQVYGIVGVQRDLMLEITRTYYLRRQLYLRLLLRPPSDAIAAEALRIRVEEFTALLDVLTGGWFSRTASRRARRRRAYD